MPGDIDKQETEHEKKKEWQEEAAPQKSDTGGAHSEEIDVQETAYEMRDEWERRLRQGTKK